MPDRGASRRLREATRAVLVAQGALEPARRPCGTPLSMPHAHALIELSGRSPMSVTALAERLSIDRTNVSRLCARMEAAGELRRVEDPSDRRAWRLELTPKGARAARAVDAASAARFGGLLDALGDDADAVIEALERLAAAMQRQGPSASPPADP